MKRLESCLLHKTDKTDREKKKFGQAKNRPVRLDVRKSNFKRRVESGGREGKKYTNRKNLDVSTLSSLDRSIRGSGKKKCWSVTRNSVINYHPSIFEMSFLLPFFCFTMEITKRPTDGPICSNIDYSPCVGADELNSE